MAMSSGTSSGLSRGTHGSRSEDNLDLEAQMEKKRKRRKESNRESARRSRMRKQQHLDDLNSQVNQLKDQNQQLSTALGMATQNLAAVQAQNSVLQTRRTELGSWLCALGEILSCMDSIASATVAAANPAAMGSITTGGACDIFGTGTWSQAMDLYQCL